MAAGLRRQADEPAAAGEMELLSGLTTMRVSRFCGESLARSDCPERCRGLNAVTIRLHIPSPDFGITGPELDPQHASHAGPQKLEKVLGELKCPLFPRYAM